MICIVLTVFVSVRAGQCLAPVSQVYRIRKFDEPGYLIEGFPDLYAMWMKEFGEPGAPFRNKLNMGRTFFSSVSMTDFFSNTKNMNEGLIPFIILCLTPQVWFEYITDEDIFLFEKMTATETSPEIYERFKLIKTIRNVESYRDFFLPLAELKKKYPPSERDPFNSQLDPMNIKYLTDGSDKRLDTDPEYTHLYHIYSTLSTLAMTAHKFHNKKKALYAAGKEDLKRLGTELLDDRAASSRETVREKEQAVREAEEKLSRLKETIKKMEKRYYRNLLAILLLKRLIVRHFFRPNLLSLRDYLPKRYRSEKRTYTDLSAEELQSVNALGFALFHVYSVLVGLRERERIRVPFEPFRNIAGAFVGLFTRKGASLVFKREPPFVSKTIALLEGMVRGIPEFLTVDLKGIRGALESLESWVNRQMVAIYERRYLLHQQHRQETIAHIINLCAKLNLPVEKGMEILEAMGPVLGPIAFHSRSMERQFEEVGFKMKYRELDRFMPMFRFNGTNGSNGKSVHARSA